MIDSKLTCTTPGCPGDDFDYVLVETEFVMGDDADIFSGYACSVCGLPLKKRGHPATIERGERKANKKQYNPETHRIEKKVYVQIDPERKTEELHVYDTKPEFMQWRKISELTLIYVDGRWVKAPQ